MLTYLTADLDDEPDITDPVEIAQLFADIAAVAIEAIGPEQAKLLFEAVLEQDGREPN